MAAPSNTEKYKEEKETLQKLSLRTHNCQKMENKSLHASAIYRIETDDLSRATNIFKVTIFVNM